MNKVPGYTVVLCFAMEDYSNSNCYYYCYYYEYTNMNIVISTVILVEGPFLKRKSLARLEPDAFGLYKQTSRRV